MYARCTYGCCLMRGCVPCRRPHVAHPYVTDRAMAHLYERIAAVPAAAPTISVAGGARVGRLRAARPRMCHATRDAGNRDTTVRSELCAVDADRGIARLTASAYGVWLQTDHDVRRRGGRCMAVIHTACSHLCMRLPQCILWCGQMVPLTRCLFAAFSPDGTAFTDESSVAVARARSCFTIGEDIALTVLMAPREETDLRFDVTGGTAVWRFGAGAAVQATTRCVSRWRRLVHGSEFSVVTSLPRHYVRVFWRSENGTSIGVVCTHSISPLLFAHSNLNHEISPLRSPEYTAFGSEFWGWCAEPRNADTNESCVGTVVRWVS